MRRTGTERSEVGKTLGGSQVIWDATALRTARHFKRRVATQVGVRVAVGGDARLPVANIVVRRGSAQAPTMQIEPDRCGRIGIVGRWRRRHFGLEDLDLARVLLADRTMLEAHIMCENMNLAPLLGAHRCWEDHGFARLVASEESQFGIVLEGNGIVEIEVTLSKAQCVSKGYANS